MVVCKYTRMHMYSTWHNKALAEKCGWRISSLL